MTQNNNLDHSYSEALQLLKNGDHVAATNILHSDLLLNPRASQTLYLFGLCHIMAENYDFGLSCICRAFDIKPWLRDDMSGIPGLAQKILDIKTKKKPHQNFIEYIRLRNLPLSIGLSYDSVIQLLMKKKAPISFIEIGANDGKSGDPIYSYVKDGRLQGILIEPMPETFKALQKTYAHTSGNTFLNCGIGASEGELELFHSDLSTLTTANPQKNALKGVSSLKSTIIPQRTLASVFKEFTMKELDVLQIDTEGYEWEILKNFSLRDYDISVIYLEFYCLSIAERCLLLKKLLEAKYSYYFDGMNLIAVNPNKFPSLVFGQRKV